MRLTAKRGLVRMAVGVAAAVPLVTGLGLVTASPASAALDCPAGEACVYSDGGYNGEGALAKVRDLPSGGCFNVGAQWNDRVSSMINNTGRYWKVYTNVNCQGEIGYVPPSGNLPVIAGNLNDRISSWSAI